MIKIYTNLFGNKDVTIRRYYSLLKLNMRFNRTNSTGIDKDDRSCVLYKNHCLFNFKDD